MLDKASRYQRQQKHCRYDKGRAHDSDTPQLYASENWYPTFGGKRYPHRPARPIVVKSGS